MSGSMAQGGLFAGAKRCAALLTAAAEIAGTDLRVIPFRAEAGRPLSSREVSHETIRLGLAALRSGGSTRLAPALRLGLEGAAGRSNCSAGSGRHVVVLISDGRLESSDAQRCAKVYRKVRRQHQPPALVLPLLLGAATRGAGGGPSGEDVYEQVFGRYAAIEGDPSELSEELSEVARRWLRHAT